MDEFEFGELEAALESELEKAMRANLEFQETESIDVMEFEYEELEAALSETWDAIKLDESAAALVESSEVIDSEKLKATQVVESKLEPQATVIDHESVSEEATQVVESELENPQATAFDHETVSEQNNLVEHPGLLDEEFPESVGPGDITTLINYASQTLTEQYCSDFMTCNHCLDPTCDLCHEFDSQWCLLFPFNVTWTVVDALLILSPRLSRQLLVLIIRWLSDGEFNNELVRICVYLCGRSPDPSDPDYLLALWDEVFYAISKTPVDESEAVNLILTKFLSEPDIYSVPEEVIEKLLENMDITSRDIDDFWLAITPLTQVPGFLIPVQLLPLMLKEVTFSDKPETAARVLVSQILKASDDYIKALDKEVLLEFYSFLRNYRQRHLCKYINERLKRIPLYIIRYPSLIERFISMLKRKSEP